MSKSLRSVYVVCLCLHACLVDLRNVYTCVYRACFTVHVYVQARQVGIRDLSQFFESEYFTAHGYDPAVCLPLSQGQRDCLIRLCFLSLCVCVLPFSLACVCQVLT